MSRCLKDNLLAAAFLISVYIIISGDASRTYRQPLPLLRADRAGYRVELTTSTICRTSQSPTCHGQQECVTDFNTPYYNLLEDIMDYAKDVRSLFRQTPGGRIQKCRLSRNIQERVSIYNSLTSSSSTSQSHYIYSTLVAHYMLNLDLAVDYLNYGYTLDDTDDVRPVVTRLQNTAVFSSGIESLLSLGSCGNRTAPSVSILDELSSTSHTPLGTTTRRIYGTTIDCMMCELCQTAKNYYKFINGRDSDISCHCRSAVPRY